MTNLREILLVEDNPKDLRLTLTALQGRDFRMRVQVARDGEEALDYVFSRGQYADREFSPPQLVLLDLKLPKIDGLEVLRQLKSNPGTRSLPVVILTASNEEKDLIDGYQAGANAYIQKPVDFDEFRKIVDQLGLFWLSVNQAPPAAAFRKH